MTRLDQGREPLASVFARTLIPAHRWIRGMATSVSAWALACLLSCARAEPKLPPAPFDLSRIGGDTAYREVERFLAVGPRVAGTDGAKSAASYLSGRLRELGLPAAIDEFDEETPQGKVRFRNVLARLDGRIPGCVVLVCHYDTKGGIDGFAGANDSGSGVGILLALAQALSTHHAEGVTVWFAFVDGEECAVEYGPRDGLHGSRRLAGQLAREGGAGAIRAAIVVDMAGDRDLTLMLYENGTPELNAAVLRAAAEEGIREKISLVRSRVLDDHQPFLDVGIPAVDLIDFSYGSRPGLNDYWHTSADTIDKLSAESLTRVARIAARVVNGAALRALPRPNP